MSETELALSHIIVSRYFTILKDEGFATGGTEKKAAELLYHIHANCCRLNLEEFSVANDYEFIRCMIGIISNYNIQENEFEHGFWPKYAVNPSPFH